MSVLWCVWFISRDDSPHVSFSFAEVCEMIFAHNVHCIIHFTFILVSPKLLTKQYPVFIEKRLNCRCTPPPHTHHCFLLCVHTMPTLQGLKFSFIPYFKKKKKRKKKGFILGDFFSNFLDWATWKSASLTALPTHSDKIWWNSQRKRMHSLFQKIWALILVYSLSQDF